MGKNDSTTTENGKGSGEPQLSVSPKHPAKFSKSITEAIRRIVSKLVLLYPEKNEWWVIDPMGGVGGIFDLHSVEGEHEDRALAFLITCVEIEQEWAESAMLHERYMGSRDTVWYGDFFDFARIPHNYQSFDLVIVSPTYGNRMADHHDATDTSKRNTYKHTLGRDLADASSASMQWGEEYREFHRTAWVECYELLEPGGYFILNVKDHIRKGVKQPVSAWHHATARSVGFEHIETVDCQVGGNRQGENHEARVDSEQVYLMQKPFRQSRKLPSKRYAEQSLMKGGKS